MTIYVLQACVLALVAGVAFQRLLRGSALYVAAWTVGVVAIRARYGVDGEILFYSNDQRHHRVVANAIVELGISSDWKYLVRSGRLAYTLPASLLQWVGFDTVLALKFVSLVSFLAAAVLVVRTFRECGVEDRAMHRYLTVFGPAGLFFTMLALRETMMLFLVTLFLVTTRRSFRLASLIGAVTLRPHLAVALIFGLLFARVSLWVGRHAYYVALAMSLVVPAALGNIGYSIGSWLLDGGDLVLEKTTLSSGALTRILYNLAGLQFLAADASSTKLNVTDLIFVRIPFMETLLIPLLFTITLLSAPRLSLLRWQAFSAFSFYLGLVTVTDFNSFRQNLPFMAVFGLVIITEGVQPNKFLQGQMSPTPFGR